MAIAVIWEFPGSLSLGPLNDFWVRTSLTILTLVFFLFTYLTQDLRPKRQLLRTLSSQDGNLQIEPEDLADISPEVKQELVKELELTGPEAVPTLIQLLKDEDDDVRPSAALALGKIGPDANAAVPALIQALKGVEGIINRYGRFRQYAAEALEKINIEAETTDETDFDL